MKRGLSVLVLFFTAVISLSAQDYYPLDIPFLFNGKNLSFPLAGGLNNPQPNTVDLNNDGLPDLYVFDRTGNVQLTFINEGTAGQPSYTYAPSYQAFFPEGLVDWVLLRDYNGDGVMDLFAQARSANPAIQGIIVFNGFYEDGHIAFRRLPLGNPDDIIQFPFVNSSNDTVYTQVYVSNVDYPAIDDVDCDGDLDVLTFGPGGSYIEYYANQSVELGYGLDSLIFGLADRCWGGIFESSIEQELGLSSAPGDCFNLIGDEGGITNRHPGSTLVTFDADNDGDVELLLGDVTYNTLSFLANGGNCEQAWITDQDNNFPSYDVTAEIPIFPVGFYLDANNDNRKDLLVAPNSINISENYEVLWYYQNINTPEEPVFEFVQSDFLVGEMLDFGTGAAPAFVDYNADGLLDLVVGNSGYFEPFGERDSRLFLFENTGTPSAPAFELVDGDYLGLSIFDDNYAFAPAFGDLDGDGDLDILVGEVLGRLFYAENTAGAGNPMSFGPWQYNFQEIFVGALSVPFIIDLDRDGLADILVGERTGNINYFRNVGTAEAPSFVPNSADPPNIFALGNINAAVPPSITGYSAPVVLDQAGTHVLLTGTQEGQIEFYNGIEGNLEGTFSLQTERMGAIEVGGTTRLAVADIDNDGKLELFVGNERGGLSAFQTNLFLDSTSSSASPSEVLEWRLFPNPASQSFLIDIPGAEAARVELFTASGQLAASKRWQQPPFRLNTAELPAGIYFVRIVSGDGYALRKLVVQHGD